MSTRKLIRIALLLALASVLLSAVTLTQGQDAVTIRYALWDSNQLPSYQQCGEAFMAANPGIEVSIEQLGWQDYWTGITTGFVSGDSPDVFTDHLAKYPEFVSLEQLVDIQPLVERDGVATDIYYPGLADLWTRDGKRFGLPKDWDTIGIIYNVEMLEAAGIDPAVMDTWTWNPEDGGEFENVIAQLTLDANGNNGLSPDFDKDNVVQYGMASASTNNGFGQGYGQSEWSWLAVGNGFTHNNGVWGDEFFYDDPKLAEVIQWFADLWLVKGYQPKYEEQNTLGREALFKARTVAMTADGSWTIGDFRAAEFPVGFGRLPAGPEGRKSMFNGLADSIWVGTQHLEESWSWVKFLASLECQTIVGEAGVVFPAIPEAAAISLQMREDAGIDISAYLEQANEENGTFLFPITDFGGEIATIMGETMDSIALGQIDAATALAAANEEVNSLFE